MKLKIVKEEPYDPENGDFYYDLVDGGYCDPKNIAQANQILLKY